MTPIVTIVSIYYNRAESVARSTDSLLEQTLKDCHIILIDDGSTDATSNELNKYAIDRRVKVVTQTNRGFTNTLAEICKHIESPYIAIHASGDVSLPTRIEAQLTFMESKSACALVGSDVRHHLRDGTYRDHCVRSEQLHATFRQRRACPIDHCTFFLRTKAVKEIGGYRPVFEHAQDFDMFLRLRRQWEIASISEILVESRAYMMDSGVRTVPEKRILQKFYADLARQCDHVVRRGGEDLVEKWGRGALFLRNKSATLRQRFILSAIRSLARGDIRTSALNLSCAQHESGLLFGTALAAAGIIIEPRATLSRVTGGFGNFRG